MQKKLMVVCFGLLILVGGCAKKQTVKPEALVTDLSNVQVKAGKPVSVEIKIMFDSGKAKVKPEYYSEIQKIADFMKKYPDTKTEIQGHSDNSGDRNKNLALSQKRAASVRAIMIEKLGIEQSRLTAVGYGPDRPVTSNDTPEGRKTNRRVLAAISTMEK